MSEVSLCEIYLVMLQDVWAVASVFTSCFV